MIEEFQSWMPFAGSLLAFLASHAIPARPPVRKRLVGMLGQRPYLLIYSLTSLLLLGWLFRAAAEAPYVELWPTLEWQFRVPQVLVPVAFVLGALGLATPNPLSLSVTRRQADPAAHDILRVTRHPVLWALALWALAHLVPNGDLAHVLLFGIMLALCLFGMVALDRRSQRRVGRDQWQSLAASRPLLPFSRRFWVGLPSLRQVSIALLGLSLAAAMALLHEAIIGVSAV